MSWDWWTPRAVRRRPGQKLTSEIINMIIVVTLAVAGTVFLVRRIVAPEVGPTPAALGATTMNEPGFRARCGPPSADPFVVTWVHGPELSAWINPASTAFMRACPNTQVRLYALDDISAAKAIVAGELEPTVWSPSDSSMLDYLEARWAREPARAQLPLVLESDASLLHTPMVLLIWADRRELLERVLGSGLDEIGSLALSSCAGIDDELAALEAAQAQSAAERGSPDWVPGDWDALWLAAHPAPAEAPAEPSLTELERWGRVRVAHASPPDAPLGLLSLYMISREHLDSAGQLDAEQLTTTLHTQRERLLTWLRRCEAGLDAPLPSARLLTETMFNLGDPALDARGFDAVLTSEQLAFAVLERIDRHEQALRPAELVYPVGALTLDYPVAFVGQPRPAIRDAARRFMNYLRTPELQTRALELGYRPAIDDPRVSLRDYDTGPNPFVRLRRHGVELEPEQLGAPRVEGETLLELVDVWRSATGR